VFSFYSLILRFFFDPGPPDFLPTHSHGLRSTFFHVRFCTVFVNQHDCCSMGLPSPQDFFYLRRSFCRCTTHGLLTVPPLPSKFFPQQRLSPQIWPVFSCVAFHPPLRPAPLGGLGPSLANTRGVPFFTTPSHVFYLSAPSFGFPPARPPLFLGFYSPPPAHAPHALAPFPIDFPRTLQIRALCSFLFLEFQFFSPTGDRQHAFLFVNLTLALGSPQTTLPLSLSFPW